MHSRLLLDLNAYLFSWSSPLYELYLVYSTAIIYHGIPQKSRLLVKLTLRTDKKLVEMLKSGNNVELCTIALGGQSSQ